MRAVLLGMNNPVSPKPEHALYPYPPGCTGHRVWMLLQMRLPNITRKEYLDGFERINLINAKEWDRAAAEASAAKLPSLYRGRTILALGGAVRDALKLPAILVHPYERDGVTWRQLPHPSGRCRWYNDPECQMLAAVLLEELYLQSKGDQP